MLGEEKKRSLWQVRNIMRECEAKFCLMNFYLFDKHRKTPLKRENSKALRYVTLGYFSSLFNTTGLAIFFCPQQRNLINTKINQWSEEFFLLNVTLYLSSSLIRQFKLREMVFFVEPKEK